MLTFRLSWQRVKLQDISLLLQITRYTLSSKVPHQQLSCVLKSVAPTTVALATLTEMLSADLHNHEH